MKNLTLTLVFLLNIFLIFPIIGQEGREVFSKGYNSTPWEIQRLDDGTWLFITNHSAIPGAIYTDTMTVYHTDSTGNIINSIPLTPPRNFEHFAIEELEVIPGGSFVAIYSGGDCDAGGYAYYAEVRDLEGQLQWLKELQMGYTIQAIGISLDSHILISTDQFVTKYSSVDGSILWEADHNNTYTNELMIVPGTEDILVADHTGLKYFIQESISGEVTYRLKTFTPLVVSQGSIGNLIADGDSVFYAFSYFEKKLLRFNADLQPVLFATLTKHPLDMVCGNDGVYILINENYNSTKLFFLDTGGNQMLLHQFTNSGLRPDKLLARHDGLGLIGSYGSGPEIAFPPGYKYLSRSQAWFKYFPNYLFTLPQDSVDIVVSNIIQQDSIQYSTYWVDGPFPAYLHAFDGGNFNIEISNLGSDVIRSCWINIAFGENLNEWFCPSISVKQLYVDNLELQPGESVWVEFGDISAYNQAEIPDQFCFWTSGPNHFPDYAPDNDPFCINRIVATTDISAHTMSVYPNPANNELTIQFAENRLASSTWKIIDLYGRDLIQGRITADKRTETISLQELPSGFYIFVSGSYSTKIVVQR